MHPPGSAALVKSHLLPSMVWCLVFLGSALVFFGTDKKWISVDVRIGSVFPDTVTYKVLPWVVELGQYGCAKTKHCFFENHSPHQV